MNMSIFISTLGALLLIFIIVGLYSYIQELKGRVSKLEKQMEEFHQFYCVTNDDDMSLVDMVKKKREKNRCG